MMKLASLISAMLLVGVLMAQNGTYQQIVAGSVRAQLDQGAKLDIIVLMDQQADLSGAEAMPTKEAKSFFVFERLRQMAYQTQQPINQLLKERGAFANSFFLVNAISVEKADYTLVRDLAAMPGVKHIFEDPWVKLDMPEHSPAAQSTAFDRNAIEWGVQQIGAPSVWALGYNGQGVTIGGADTGYEWTHPTNKPHYRGYSAVHDTVQHNYNWFDAVTDKSPLNGDSLNPCGFRIGAPCDDNSHGTHTMGTMIGDDGQGNQIGVAPGAKWIGCRNMERGWGRPSTYLGCFEWFLAPTDTSGQNPNPIKAPHVINNSWYCADIEGCDQPGTHELLRQAIINLKASGVVVIISVGNSGNACSSAIHPPGYFEESFSIGATDILDSIAGFSSRGPITIDGSNRIKPNVSAPGVNVRSSVLNGGFANYGGTSMAGPHVAAAVALMISANPQLAGKVSVIETILEETAIPYYDAAQCGAVPGFSVPNNAYGYGRIDALAAVQRALAYTSSSALEPNESAPITVMPTIIHDFCTIIGQKDGEAQVSIFDAAGQLLIDQSVQLQAMQPSTMALSQMPNGALFYRITQGDAVVSGLLIKQ